MHEHGVMKALMRRIDDMARAEHARRVTSVSVTLGALSHMTPGHFAEHFAEAATGTIAEGALLDMRASDDIQAPGATDVVLTGIEIEE
jgi:hydrogenase nickel incorporation protein HypA/HybF